MGINIFASIPPIETREVASSCYVGSDALLMISLLDSVLEVHSVDPFYSPLCHGVLASEWKSPVGNIFSFLYSFDIYYTKLYGSCCCFSSHWCRGQRLKERLPREGPNCQINNCTPSLSSFLWPPELGKEVMALDQACMSKGCTIFLFVASI